MRLRINKTGLLIVICCVILYFPESLFYFGAPQAIKYLKYIILAFVTGVYIKRGNINSNPYLLVLTLGALVVLSSAINSSNIVGSIQLFLGFSGIYAFYGLIVASKSHLKYIKYTSIFFAVMITINTLLVVLYPNGFYIVGSFDVANSVTTFLGLDNAAFMYYVEGLFLASVLYYIKGCKILFPVYCYVLMIFYSVFRSIGAGIIAELFIGIMYFAYVKNLLFKKNNYTKVFIIVFYIVNILIVFLQLQFSFTDVIARIAGKRPDFTGRTTLWNYAILRTLQKPILGNGLQTAVNYNNVSFSTLGSAYVDSGNTHNLLLQVLYLTGFLGLIVFTIILFYSFNKFEYYNKNAKNSKIVIIIVMAFLVRSIVEIGIEYFFFFMPFLCLLNEHREYSDNKILHGRGTFKG